MAQKYAKVLYQYETQNPDSELSINVDEILTIERDQGEWWLAKNNAGQTGYIPSNYAAWLENGLLKSDSRQSV